MTPPRRDRNFNSADSGPNIVARATLTIMAMAVSIRASLRFTDAHCPCGRKVMAIPGAVLAEVRTLASDSERSGRGRVVSCKRCGALCEVIEHGKAA